MHSSRGRVARTVPGPTFALALVLSTPACGEIAAIESPTPNAAPPSSESPPPPLPPESPLAPTNRRLNLLDPCDNGEGDTELTWDAVPGASAYRVTWDGGEALVEQPKVRLTGYGRSYVVRAVMADRSTGAEAQWRSPQFSSVGGDTLLLRGRRDGKTTWEPISCMERRLSATQDEVLAHNAAPSFVAGSSPSSLVGSVFLLPQSEEEGAGELVVATADRLIRLGHASPWSHFPIELDLVPASPVALFVDTHATYASRADGAVVRVANPEPGQEAGATRVLGSSELVGRHVFGLVPGAEGDLWVLAAHDGTSSGRPGRVLHFAQLALDATPDASIELPDDSPSSDYRFDPIGFTVFDRKGAGKVYVAQIDGAAFAWNAARGALDSTVHSLRSSEDFTFVTGGANGSRISVYPRHDFRAPLFEMTVPDATELEIAGFTPRYPRPSVP